MTITDRTSANPAAGQPATGDPAAGNDDTPWGLASPMRVRKRNGDLEPVDLNKIVRAVGRAAADGLLDGVDPMRVATRTISGLHDGATTMELDELSHPHRGRPHQRGAELQPPRRPPAGHVHRQGGGQPGHPLVLASRSPSATAPG